MGLSALKPSEPNGAVALSKRTPAWCGFSACACHHWRSSALDSGPNVFRTFLSLCAARSPVRSLQSSAAYVGHAGVKSAAMVILVFGWTDGPLPLHVKVMVTFLSFCSC